MKLHCQTGKKHQTLAKKLFTQHESPKERKKLQFKMQNNFRPIYILHPLLNVWGLFSISTPFTYIVIVKKIPSSMRLTEKCQILQFFELTLMFISCENNFEKFGNCLWFAEWSKPKVVLFITSYAWFWCNNENCLLTYNKLFGRSRLRCISNVGVESNCKNWTLRSLLCGSYDPKNKWHTDPDFFVPNRLHFH